MNAYCKFGCRLLSLTVTRFFFSRIIHCFSPEAKYLAFVLIIFICLVLVICFIEFRWIYLSVAYSKSSMKKETVHIMNQNRKTIPIRKDCDSNFLLVSGELQQLWKAVIKSQVAYRWWRWKLYLHEVGKKSRHQKYYGVPFFLILKLETPNGYKWLVNSAWLLKKTTQCDIYRQRIEQSVYANRMIIRV